jgi:hypothetical protein
LERYGGKAIIISHIANLDECDPTWGRRFHALMDRYQHIVRFSMHGHTHEEQYQVIRGIQDHKPIGLSFLVGSVTPWVGRNPGFSVITFDYETSLPIEIETHYLDIIAANTNLVANWTFLHNYR